MSASFSRRDALKGVALFVSASCTLGARASGAVETMHLSPTDPTAVALGYHESFKQVDPKAFPTYQLGQSCSTCMQLQGAAGDAWRPCNLFPGKLVHVDGWCKVWIKKP